MVPGDRYLPVRSRCLQPGQQQGRRWPSSSSSWVRRMRRSRVVSCLASSTQQMNSLRAKGVMSFQASSAVALAISALRRSAGKSMHHPTGHSLAAHRPMVVSRGKLRFTIRFWDRPPAARCRREAPASRANGHPDDEPGGPGLRGLGS